jgi:ABC-type amino acid transport substrate-binding protein
MSVASGRLKIAVFERPPYSFKDKDGNWTGLSIDLWEQIAGRLGLSFDYVETPLSEVYVQLQSGACDLSPVIPLSQEKAGLVDFTEPYLFSHGAVVIPKKTFLDTLKTLHSYIWSREVFIIFLAMLIGMTVFSFLLMLVERKHVSGHFSGPSMKGLGSALWFSAVTMTTVGYGDKTPLSVVGRLITFFWMLVGVLLIALFTGTVASSITTAQIQNGVVRFDDLSRFHLGCLEGSRMDFLLRNRGIPAIRYTGLDGGFEGFKRGEINAYAGDSVTLEYWMTHNAPGKFQISLIPDSAMIYAFATRHHLPQLSEINRELLEIALAPDWRSKAERWTGPLSF